jgi:hypothetical protein
MKQSIIDCLIWSLCKTQKSLQLHNWHKMQLCSNEAKPHWLPFSLQTSFVGFVDFESTSVVLNRGFRFRRGETEDTDHSKHPKQPPTIARSAGKASTTSDVLASDFPVGKAHESHVSCAITACEAGYYDIRWISIITTFPFIIDMCHDHVIPTSDLWSLILFSDPVQPGSTLTIIAVAPCYLFGLGPIGLHQSLCLNTARMTLSITERSMLLRTLRTLETIITLTVPSLTHPLMWCSTFRYLCMTVPLFRLHMWFSK